MIGLKKTIHHAKIVEDSKSTKMPSVLAQVMKLYMLEYLYRRKRQQICIMK